MAVKSGANFPLLTVTNNSVISCQVIKGWDIGVSTMTVGELATFYIKADYGYGSAGSPPKVF